MKKRVSFLTIGVALVSMLMLLAPGVLHAAAPLVPPTPPATYNLGDFLILVDDQLILPGPANVNCCLGPSGARSDLGSRSTIVLGGSATVNAPVGAPTIQDVAIIAPTVTLKKFAKVSQTITQSAASLIKSGSGIVGPSVATVDPNLPSDLPAFPPFPPSITVGTNDINVPAKGTVTISPTLATFSTTPPTTVAAPFRDLIIGANATVIFDPGGSTAPYQFRRIIANTASKYQLIFNAPNITVNVAEFVRLAEFGLINQAHQTGLVFNVAGTDGTYGGANKNKLGVVRPPAGAFPAAFEYDGDGVFVACFVFVKNGTANLRGITLYATQWFANSLQQIPNLTITLESPGEKCFISTPCPCCDQCL